MRLPSPPAPVRARLLHAALELLAERGYRGATTREIARRAGVSEVTLFRHFRRKEDLMREALALLPGPGFLEGLPGPETPLEEGLRAVLSAYSGLLERQRALLPKLLAELLRHPNLGAPPGLLAAKERLVAFFRAKQEEGALRPDEPPEELVLAFVGPLFARFLLGQALGLSLPLDPEAYLGGYLEGRYGPRRGAHA